jgi:anti-sigma factor RsiW
MTCQEAILLIHAYSDGELDLVHALELEKHLAACPSCSQACENARAVKLALSSSELYAPAPGTLRRNILKAIRAHDRTPKRSPIGWWEMFKIAIQVTGLALVALLLVPLISGRTVEDRLAQEVASAHVRSLMLDHKTDVASLDKHTVKPWFQGKLDFSPPVADLADRGFPLVGGRLDYLQGRPAAALVYQREQHIINVFIWPTPDKGTALEKFSVRQGYNTVHWSALGMTFWAVSDLNRTDLTSFVQLLK